MLRSRLNDLNSGRCWYVELGFDAALSNLAIALLTSDWAWRHGDRCVQILRFAWLDQILDSKLRVSDQIFRFQN